MEFLKTFESFSTEVKNTIPADLKFEIGDLVSTFSNGSMHIIDVSNDGKSATASYEKYGEAQERPVRLDNVEFIQRNGEYIYSQNKN